MVRSGRPKKLLIIYFKVGHRNSVGYYTSIYRFVYTDLLYMDGFCLHIMQAEHVNGTHYVCK